jgi:uncharacterized protein (DUF4415 family)
MGVPPRKIAQFRLTGFRHFSQSRRNPYVKQLKRQITIRIDAAAVDYFKRMAAEMGMPYQNLINLFLRDCAIQKRRPMFQWSGDAPGGGGRRAHQPS